MWTNSFPFCSTERWLILICDNGLGSSGINDEINDEVFSNAYRFTGLVLR